MSIRKSSDGLPGHWLTTPVPRRPTTVHVLSYFGVQKAVPRTQEDHHSDLNAIFWHSGPTGGLFRSERQGCASTGLTWESVFNPNQTWFPNAHPRSRTPPCQAIGKGTSSPAKFRTGLGDRPSEYPGWLYVDARHSLTSLVFIGDGTALLLYDSQSSVSGPHQDLCTPCALHVSGEFVSRETGPLARIERELLGTMNLRTGSKSISECFT
jgi:hypothetical protein